MGENLRNHIDEAHLFRTLTTLRYDVPIEESLADLEWQGVLQQQYLEFCDELGFDSIQERPHRWR